MATLSLKSLPLSLLPLPLTAACSTSRSRGLDLALRAPGCCAEVCVWLRSRGLVSWAQSLTLVATGCQQFRSEGVAGRGVDRDRECVPARDLLWEKERVRGRTRGTDGTAGARVLDACCHVAPYLRTRELDSARLLANERRGRERGRQLILAKFDFAGSFLSLLRSTRSSSTLEPCRCRQSTPCSLYTDRRRALATTRTLADTGRTRPRDRKSVV